MNKVAFDYLMRDPLHHAGMLEMLKSGDADVAYAGADAVLLFGGNVAMLSAENEAASMRLLPRLADAEIIALHQNDLIGPLKEAYGVVPAMGPCVQVSYRRKEPLPENPPDGVEIRLLNESHLDFVMAHYAYAESRAYIMERIAEGMFGAFVEGALAGFMGTHSEGSMGLLFVLPAYRRHGLAYHMESALINRQLSLGRIPYGDVGADNAASLALQRRLGMSISEGLVYWMEKPHR